MCSSENVEKTTRNEIIQGPEGEKAEIEIEVYECKNCKEEFFDAKTARAFSQKAKAAGILRRKADRALEIGYGYIITPRTLFLTKLAIDDARKDIKEVFGFPRLVNDEIVLLLLCLMGKMVLDAAREGYSALDVRNLKDRIHGDEKKPLIEFLAEKYSDMFIGG